MFAALASDFDLNNIDHIGELRNTLDSIKDLAIQQECLPFDPSGTANDYDQDVVDMGATFSDLAATTQTDETSMASNLISDDSKSQSSNGKGKMRPRYTVTEDGSLELVGTSLQDSVDALLDMFPSVSRMDIEQQLKKNDNDVSKSMDVLLNLAFFDETKDAPEDTRIVIPKGINGFDTDLGAASKPGKKKKRSKNRKMPLQPTRYSEDTPVNNKWETGQADVDFIYSRTVEISKVKIASVYHANGASLPATIRALALAGSPKAMSEIDDEPIMLTQITELSQEFPAIPSPLLVGLLRITRNMISATQELAEAMMRSPKGPLQDMIRVSMAPLNLEEIEEEAADAKSRRRGKPSMAYGYEEAQARAESSFAAGRAAREQAAQAARRARSNPLYGGAAAVYHERAQAERELGMQHLAMASDSLVDRQSSHCDLDLHGVTVVNATRIARDRVEAWWDSLGDTKHVRGGGKHVHGGYKIVTGVGLHSPDGTSRLGPAVSKMLMAEGWRVEISRGFLIVTGKARR